MPDALLGVLCLQHRPREPTTGLTCSMLNALLTAKSSQCTNTLRPNRRGSACTTSCMSSAYSTPRSLGCGVPTYSGSCLSCALFVPTSTVMGRSQSGGAPAAPYTTHLPVGMPMPCAPRSPRPRIRSPSVMTAIRTCSNTSGGRQKKGPLNELQSYKAQACGTSGLEMAFQQGYMPQPWKLLCS